MSKSLKIQECLHAGLLYQDISEKLSVSKATISYHAKRLGLSRGRSERNYDWTAIQAFHDAGNSRMDCRRRFGFANETWAKAVRRGDILVRPHRAETLSLCVENSTFSRGTLKRRLIAEEILAEVCRECGTGSEWNGKPLTLSLDHINGVNNDNRLENLRLLCPNCHSQTETFAGRNVKRAD